MWKLFKSIVAYNWPTFLNLLAQSLVMFLFIHIYVLAAPDTISNKNIGYNSLHHMLIIFIVMIIATPWGKEKRIRQFLQLPASTTSVGLVHLSLFAIYWISIVMLFFLYCAVSVHYKIDKPTIFALCSQTGIAFILYSVVFAGQNFRKSCSDKYRISNIPQNKIIVIPIVVLVVVFSVLAIAGIIHIYQNYAPSVQMKGNIFTWMYFSESGLIAFLMLGFLFSVLTVLSFSWRKSYVE